MNHTKKKSTQIELTSFDFWEVKVSSIKGLLTERVWPVHSLIRQLMHKR
jgi:hypothetical protein